MSFYDLTKDNVLSANQLFKHRLKQDAAVPSRGGQKCFEPDGSWMHAKALESFMQERGTLLGEQRVEKLKGLVQGVWEPDKLLVNLNKPGKFWAHMGFTDKSRNWLYPEEALFLMETNTLEVYNNGLPLSIQEAYIKFIGPDLSLEEYQVYAHLRRLGYVVLRQEAQLEITPYEKQINLDKYMTKQNRKDRKRKLVAQGKSLAINRSGSPQEENGNAVEATSDDKNKGTEENSQKECANDSECSMDSSSMDISSQRELTDTTPVARIGETLNHGSSSLIAADHVKRQSPEGGETTDENGMAKKAKLESSTSDTLELEGSVGKQDSTSNKGSPHMSWYMDDVWTSCFKKLSSSSSSSLSSSKSQSENGFSSASKVKVANTPAELGSDDNKMSKTSIEQTFPLPTIANKSMLNLPQPMSKLLPPNVVVNEDYNDILVFDVERYRFENPAREESRNAQREEEREVRIRNLEFSFAEWTQRKMHIKAENWADYKHKMQEMSTSSSARTPVEHLWSGRITPLIRPEDAIDKRSILDRLSIIKSADNEVLLPNSDCMVDLKVSFSVHLPDSKFKKSMPGVPNHRVCVFKCSGEPPNLAEIQEVWSRFKDNVPLHCAVVDSGEIAFYIFDNTFKLEVLP